MKIFSLMLAVMLASPGFAVEMDIDGNFNDFKHQWTLSTTRHGTAEVIRVNGTNFVHLASENDAKGQIAIYTARGIMAKRGDKIAVSADIKGAPMTISLAEYGKKKFIANQTKKFKKSNSQQTYNAEFTVSDPKTDLVRVSFKVVKGAVIVISNVKVNMISAGENAE